MRGIGEKVKINVRWILVRGGVLSLLILYGLLWLRMINSPSERTGTDFVGFFAAARIAQSQGPAWIYSPTLQQQIEQELVGFPLAPGQVLLFNHMPYFVPILSLIVNADFVESFNRWGLVLVAIILTDALLFLSLASFFRLDRELFWIIAASTALFFPLFTSVLNGQDTAFLLLGAILWLVGLLSGKDVLAGIGLSITTIRPQVALLLAVPFLFNRRRVWWWFMAGAAALGLFVILYLGPDGTIQFVNILSTSSLGDAYGFHPEDMPTLTGLLHRSFSDLPSTTVRLIGLVGYGLTCVGFCLLWAKSKHIGGREAGLVVLATMFFSPYLHFHDLALLLIPMFCLLIVSSPPLKRNIVLLPLVTSFLFLLGYIQPVLRYIFDVVVMAGLAILLWKPNIMPLPGVNRHA